MNSGVNCPKCSSEYAYQDGNLWICPECSYEWNNEITSEEVMQDNNVRDSNGNILVDGDSISLIKDLKIKGSSSVIKGGTKVKNIKIVDASDGHNIACKIDGIGAINLKSEFVKKS